MSKERPILFSSAMVKALLDGSKTQTRRVVKPQPIFQPETTEGALVTKAALIWQKKPQPKKLTPNPPPHGWNIIEDFLAGFVCPYGGPKDTLWVREAFQTCPKCGTLNYAATVNKPKNCSGCDEWLGSWKPSIHMPRSASRITLEITGVRVERLIEITSDDAKAEGVRPTTREWINDQHPKRVFADLWESINGKGSWEKNPWVWVIEFKHL